MAKSKSYGGLVVLLLLVVAGAGGSWYYFRGTKEAKPEFQTTRVGVGDIVQVVTATGDLQPVVVVDVSSQISGQVIEVLVDFNSVVKAGDVLAKIDEATYIQRLRQAEADLASARANNQLVKVNHERTKDLFAKNLVSQAELDSVTAQLAQSNATLLTREAAVENAKVDLARCTITAPIDGIILDRRTDKGRTVAASLNAPVLFTLVQNLTKMQINAAVAEADIGSIAEGQEVKFTVDAFPNRTFQGTVRQVRNAAAINQSVVSYGTIIEVDNEDLRLKPGMTANVSIIVSQRPRVLRVANSALRVRIPPELQSMVKPPAGGPEGAVTKSGKIQLTDDEVRAAIQDIITQVGFRPGQVATPDMIEKARTMAKSKGLDPDTVAARLATPRGNRGVGGARGQFGRGGRNVGGGAVSSGISDRGFNNTVVTRPLYKLVDPNDPQKGIETVMVKLGISDGFYTEVLEGLEDGDALVTSVRMPSAGGQSQGATPNPFTGGGRGGFGGGAPMRRG